MSSNNSSKSISKEDRIVLALRDAQRQGLPADWTVTVDDKNRKRWYSPNPERKKFQSLVKALEYALGGNDTTVDVSKASTSTMPSSSSKKRPNSSSRKKSQDRKKSKVSSSSSRKRKTPSSNDSQTLNQSTAATSSTVHAENTSGAIPKETEDYESDPETSLYISHNNDNSSSPSSNRNQSVGTVHWDPNSLNGSKVGYRIRVYDFKKHDWQQNYKWQKEQEARLATSQSPQHTQQNTQLQQKGKQKQKKQKQKQGRISLQQSSRQSLNQQQQKQKQKECEKHFTSCWKHGRVIRYDPVSHKHKVLFFDDDDDDNYNDDNDDGYNEKCEWLILKHETIQLGGDFVWALVKGFAWWPAQVLHCHFGHPRHQLQKMQNDKDGNRTTTKDNNASYGININMNSSRKNNKDMTLQPLRDGYVLVEFFDSDEVASIKNTPDLLRPFNKGYVDSVIAKNKKKRNLQAIESGTQEEIATQQVRNDAAKFYAACAFHCANRNANYYLGMKIEVFRSDINYPVGAKLIGTVRQCSVGSTGTTIGSPPGSGDGGSSSNTSNSSSSTGTRKWLIAYDPPPVNKEQYSPTWINLMNKSITFKFIDQKKGSKRKNYEPNEDDLFPFLFGYKHPQSQLQSKEQENVSIISANTSNTFDTKCRGCVGKLNFEKDTIIQCSECMGYYHPGCVDPPVPSRSVDSILRNKKKWVCNKCIRCTGCRELEITFGTKVVPQPSSLFLEDDGKCTIATTTSSSNSTALHLCSSCIPMYEKEMYCPNCAHIWDDVRFQRIQSRVKKKQQRQWRHHHQQQQLQQQHEQQIQQPQQQSEIIENKPIVSSQDDDKNDIKNSENNDDHNNDPNTRENEQIQKDVGFRWKSPSSIEDSWFHPEETDAWGYNEAAMVCCESCNLWVHAACAEFSQTEYELTNEGKHPIYSNEFLCRICCKRKCLSLVDMLKKEDTMGLFAEPVTDKVAHNYSDIIKKPMDLQTMMNRAQEGDYRNYAWLRESFELMVYNALTFNIGYTTYWNEAKRFYEACTKNVFIPEGKGAPISKYVDLINERFEIADRAVQAEKDRVKTDATVEKKDLIAGSQVSKVILGPLEKPCDPPSCVPCTEVRYTPMEALFCAWMDCCYTCGSSGAADTFLFCVDCGEAYHSFCSMAPIHSMNEAAVSGWRCPNCKLCEITGEMTEDETKLLYCEMCDRAFSIDLIDPPLESVPSGLWICGQCIDCTKCKNTHYNGVVSRASWSNDPSICRGCIDADEKKAKEMKAMEEQRKEVEMKQVKKVATKHEKKVVVKSEKTKKRVKEKMKSLKSKKKMKEQIKSRLDKKKKKEQIKPIKDKQKIKDRMEPTSNSSSKLSKSKPKKQVKPNAKPEKTKEQLKEEALVTAMNEAKSRGLPDGWTCFYGAANRKRWRSPPPHQRVFDSIPKALLFVEKMKNGSPTPTKQKARNHKHFSSTKAFNSLVLNLNEHQEWKDRESGYDDNTSLMSDAETLLRILEPKLGVNFCELFDPLGKIISCSEELKAEPPWVYQRAARFVRFVKRLSKRNQKQRKKKKGIDRASQIVVCKMASAFIYVVCRIFNIDIKTTIKSYNKMESLLISVDLHSGTVALSLPIKKHRIHRKGGRYEYKFAMGKGKYDPTSNGPVIHSEEQDCEISMSAQDYEIASALVGDPQQLPAPPTATALSIMTVQNYVNNALSSHEKNLSQPSTLAPKMSFDPSQNDFSTISEMGPDNFDKRNDCQSSECHGTTSTNYNCEFNSLTSGGVNETHNDEVQVSTSKNTHCPTEPENIPIIEASSVPNKDTAQQPTSSISSNEQNSIRTKDGIYERVFSSTTITFDSKETAVCDKNAILEGDAPTKVKGITSDTSKNVEYVESLVSKDSSAIQNEATSTCNITKSAEGESNIVAVGEMPSPVQVGANLSNTNAVIESVQNFHSELSSSTIAEVAVSSIDENYLIEQKSGTESKPSTKAEDDAFHTDERVEHERSCLPNTEAASQGQNENSNTNEGSVVLDENKPSEQLTTSINVPRRMQDSEVNDQLIDKVDNSFPINVSSEATHNHDIHKGGKMSKDVNENKNLSENSPSAEVKFSKDDINLQDTQDETIEDAQACDKGPLCKIIETSEHEAKTPQTSFVSSGDKSSKTVLTSNLHVDTVDNESVSESVIKESNADSLGNDVVFVKEGDSKKVDMDICADVDEDHANDDGSSEDNTLSTNETKEEMSTQDFDVANALLGLTSPKRSKPNSSSLTTVNDDNNVENETSEEKAVELPWLTSSHPKVCPMLGWESSSNSEMESLREWKDPRVCCLCLTCGDDDAGVEPIDNNTVHRDTGLDGTNKIDVQKARGAGRLLPLPNGGWVHANCAIWSSEVWESQSGGFLNDFHKARGRSVKLKCFGCGRPGATLGCHKGNCIKNYHYSCARASGALFMESHKLYCSDHRPYAKGSIRGDFSEPMKSLKINAQSGIEVDQSTSIRCGSLVVHSLGKIQTDIDGFHSKHYIMPPGYTSTRIFWSYINPKTRTLYFMKIERSSKNLPSFVLTTADAPSKTYRSDDVTKVYLEVMKKVWQINSDYFSHGDLCSIFPMKRKWKMNQKAFCLNGPQFWGFGVDNVRKALEKLDGVVACAVPLTEKSVPYRFCFQNPTQEAVTNLQRKRAAIKAEKALENSSGCARTEGKKAVDKSTSSGRITRALVRRVEENQDQQTAKSGESLLNDSNKQNFESNQAKYREMKKYPMEQRLAAKRSHIHGWGLFAKIFFPKNSMIAEYMGEAIGQTIADKREKKYEVLGMGSCYMFRLDMYNIVDATNIGCMARFMNHCCAANAYAKVISVNGSVGLEKKIVVFANQDIQVGEEITYDYKFPVEDGSLRCTCGAPNCIGRMN